MLIPNIAKVGVESSNLFARSKSRRIKSGACRLRQAPIFCPLPEMFSDQSGDERQHAQTDRQRRPQRQPALGRQTGRLQLQIDQDAGGDEDA